MVVFSILAKFCKPLCLHLTISFLLCCGLCPQEGIQATDFLGRQNTEESPSLRNWVSCVSRTKRKGETFVICNWFPKFLFRIHKGLRNQNGPQINVKCLTGHYIGLLSSWWHHAKHGISGCQGAGITSAFSFYLVIRKGRPVAGSVLFGGNLLGLRHEFEEDYEECSYTHLTTHRGTLNQTTSFPVVIPGLEFGWHIWGTQDADVKEAPIPGVLKCCAPSVYFVSS